MQIRAITIGQRQTASLDLDALRRAGAFGRAARAAFEEAGCVVQTVRLAAQPLSQIMGRRPPSEALTLAQALDGSLAGEGIDYASLGPIVPGGDGPHPLIDELPSLLRSTERVFFSVMPATLRRGLNTAAVRQTAEALVTTCEGDVEGVYSRRFTVSANVPPHGPFFPSAYHRGVRDGYALALECADLAVDALAGARDFDEARDRLVGALEAETARMERAAARLEAHGAAFHGMDISLAPFPEEARSIAGAMERLGVGAFGGHGTLFAAAFLTDTLRRARIRTCGFSGLMLPLLEDSVMARRHAEGAYGIDELLLYSAVCGAGLDTIPVPGDVTVNEVASVYLDVCALALTLNKPLTVRLMPMAGKQAGDPVRFEFPYFAPTHVATLKSPASGGLLGKGPWRPVRARRR